MAKNGKYGIDGGMSGGNNYSSSYENPYNYKGGERKDAQRSPGPSVQMYVGPKKSSGDYGGNEAASKYHKGSM